MITRFGQSAEAAIVDSGSDASEPESIPESMFNESEVDVLDFEGFVGEVAAMAAEATAGLSTTDGTGNQ